MNLSNNRDEKNGMWKGDKVKYNGLHAWVRRRKPKPTLCERCNQLKAIDLANISGYYKRDITDFEWLCRKCHMTEDKRMNNLELGRNKYGASNGNYKNGKCIEKNLNICLDCGLRVKTPYAIRCLVCSNRKINLFRKKCARKK